MSKEEKEVNPPEVEGEIEQQRKTRVRRAARWRKQARLYGSPAGGQGKQVLFPVEIDVLAGVENIEAGDIGHEGKGEKQNFPVQAAPVTATQAAGGRKADAEPEDEVAQGGKPFGKRIKKQNRQDRYGQYKAKVSEQSGGRR